MSVFRFIKPAMAVSAALALGAFSLNTLAQGENCGEPPVSPELVDGASASMEELVANSEQVKAFIEQADGYLDCRESAMPSDEYKALSRSDQKEYREASKRVLDARNDIGEAFNGQVAAYQAANPPANP